MRIVLVLLVMFGGVVPAFAEYPRYRAVAIVEVAGNKTTGYEYPFLGAGVGMEVQTGHLFVQTDMMYSRTDKFLYKNLEQAYGRTRVMVMPGINRNYFVGGGATYSVLKFHDLGLTRSAVRPFVSVGYVSPSVLVAGEWIFPGQDKAYRVNRPVLYLEASGGYPSG